MTRVATCLAALLLAAAGCSEAEGPAVELNDVRVYAPLPGSSSAVAYFTLRNRSAEPLELVAVASPQFGQAAFHRSVRVDGVMRMEAEERLSIDPNSALTLREGGLHIMLLEPRTAVAVGEPVTLRLIDATGGEMLVRATLESRVVLE